MLASEMRTLCYKICTIAKWFGRLMLVGVQVIAFTSACGQKQIEIPEKLRSFGDFVEQIHVVWSNSYYICEDRVFNPSTGETEFRRAQFKTTDGFPVNSVFKTPELFADLLAGSIHSKTFDAYWDNNRHRWVKSSLRTQIGCPVASDLLFFRDHPLVQLWANTLKAETASTPTNAESQYRLNYLKGQLDELLTTKGTRTLETTDSGGLRKPVEFMVGEDGFIQSIKISRNNTLVEGTFNRITKGVPFMPRDVDFIIDATQVTDVSQNGLIGLRLQSENGKLVIAQVAPGSPAEKARMVAGEQILSVNGKALKSFTRDEFFSLGRSSTSLTIETRTATGKVKKFTVQKVPSIAFPDRP